MFTDILDLGRLAFGCARLSTLSKKISINILEECIENKILHFDTAPSYGSEELIGDILQGVENVTITSKIGLPRVKSNKGFLKKTIKKSFKSLGNISPSLKNKIYSSINKKQTVQYEKRILSMDEIMIDLEKTLTNINKSKLDILLIHEPDQFIIDDDLIERFEKLKKEGLIANYGLGCNRPNFEMTKFGNVKQYLYDKNDDNSCDSIKVVHGLIRASILKGNHGSQHSNFIKNFLLCNSGLTVLFSASKVSQIKEICSNI